MRTSLAAASFSAAARALSRSRSSAACASTDAACALSRSRSSAVRISASAASFLNCFTSAAASAALARSSSSSRSSSVSVLVDAAASSAARPASSTDAPRSSAAWVAYNRGGEGRRKGAPDRPSPPTPPQGNRTGERWLGSRPCPNAVASCSPHPINPVWSSHWLREVNGFAAGESAS